MMTHKRCFQPQCAIRQMAFCLGKDEVPGPNPGSSSRKSCNRCGCRIFCLSKTAQKPRRRTGKPCPASFCLCSVSAAEADHGVRPPPFGGGLRFPCRGKSICESLPKPSVSDAFDRLSERACKPGSVIDSHLSRRTVAGAFQPPPWDGRAGHMSLRGVAPDRVYSAALSPAGE